MSIPGDDVTIVGDLGINSEGGTSYETVCNVADNGRQHGNVRLILNAPEMYYVLKSLRESYLEGKAPSQQTIDSLYWTIAKIEEGY
jgi:hypothetical protein